MSKRNTYQYGSHVFTSQAAVIKHASAIRKKYSIGAVIDDPDDILFLCDLISVHPNAKQKIGCGIARFYRGHAPDHRNSDCFWIERTDGQNTDIGIHACLSTVGARNRQALRMLVAPDCDAYKNDRLANCESEFVSDYSGRSFPLDQASVDHVVPFETLITDFFSSHNVDIDTEMLTYSVDKSSTSQWKKDDLIKAFLAYHDKCKLRLVSQRENLSDIKLAANALRNNAVTNA